MGPMPPALRRVISIAFVAAVVLLGARTCQVESAECQLVFRFQEQPPAGLVELQVRLFDEGEGDEPLGAFQKNYQDGIEGPPARWPLVVSAGTYRIEGEIVTREQSYLFERDVKLVDGEALTIYLDRYLR